MYYVYDAEAAKAGGYENIYKNWFKYLCVDSNYRFALHIRENPVFMLGENELMLESPNGGGCTVHKSCFRPVMVKPLNLRDYL